nr:BON domain-containing protein [Terriglobales bacterium]
MNARVSRLLVLLMILGLGAACSKAPNDAQISSDIQSKLSADSGLTGKQIAVQSDHGAVTLSGTVDNDAQRAAAARYASSAAGVRQVINNLQLPPPVTAAATPAPEPLPEPVPEPAKVKPAPVRRDRPVATERRHRTVTPPEDTTSSSTSTSTTAAASSPATIVNTTPPPPPPPVKVTIPAGTGIAVRLVDSLNSETAVQGQTFHASLDSPLSYEGDVAVPKGADVEGHIVEVKSAGKFVGQSTLVLQLDRISSGGKYYSLQTDQWKKDGSSRGKNTAEKVGAGAGIGAIIGAIAGGGKGAAIGAAAGGGLGGGVQAATKGQQIKLPSETVVNFSLQ